MMDQQNINIGQPKVGAKKMVRTMKTDVENLFKTSKPSLVQVIGGEITPETRIDAPEDRGKKIASPLPIILLTLLVVGGAAWFLLSRKDREPETPTRIATPAPFFATETSRTLGGKTGDENSFKKLVEDAAQERERRGTVKRIVIKVQDGPQERFASLSDLFAFYQIIPPDRLLDSIYGPLMSFFYYGEEGNRFGFATRTRDANRTLADMLAWETALRQELRPFFFGEKPEGSITFTFEDRTYRNIDWRFLKLSQKKDFGIGYTVFPAANLLVITTGKEMTETVINRLFDAR